MSDNTNMKRPGRAEIETILTYGLIAVVVGGGAGVYLPLTMGKNLSADALSTYIFAMLAPFWVDALLHEPYWKKLSKVIRMRIGLGCASAAILAIIALIRDGKSWDLTLGGLGTLLVLVVWFFLALYSGRFAPDEAIPPTGPLGGSEVTSAHLSGGGLQ
ncbi:MAG: hypothetical protein HY846_04910 [Nitrosomonadales bacterium]|nr:hypothetical protein [Nitrosomonadales bacterium]